MIKFACARCRKLIPYNQWSVTINAEGKTVYTAKCHGDRAEITVAVPMGGVLFSGVDVMSLKSRDPMDWIDETPPVHLVEG